MTDLWTYGDTRRRCSRREACTAKRAPEPCRGGVGGTGWTAVLGLVDRGVPGYGIARAQPMVITLVPGPIYGQNTPSFLIDKVFDEVS